LPVANSSLSLAVFGTVAGGGGFADSYYQPFTLGWHTERADIDYSLTQVIPLQKDMHTLLQVGLIGYGQYQTTDRSGPGIDPVLAANTHYKVNALGAAANIILPARKASLGFKWIKEFSNKSTVQGK
jgi:hypothetical protein